MSVMMSCGHAANATDGSGLPACAICVGIDAGATMVAAAPDLSGRQAICTCKRTVPSSMDLAFFEYRGPGSRVAAETCKCGYARCAHDPEQMARNVPNNRKTVIELGKCKGFEARGAYEFDAYYCGHCHGWD